MPIVSRAALKDRARALMVAMTERDRWIYVLPPEGSFAKATIALEAAGWSRVADAESGRVVSYQPVGGGGQIVLLQAADLEVVLVEGRGPEAAGVLGPLVEATGFLPQSGLWGRALDIGEPGSARALRLLAHMCVAWDEDWSDLFLLHLASPDAPSRQAAVAAVTLAAMVCGDTGPARALLDEAQRRERFPALAGYLAEATAVLEAYAGGSLDLATAARQ